MKKVDTIILCGGLGKRLRSIISDKPKVLAEIDGKAFLEILIDNLLSFGFRRIILSVGYKKDKIIKYFTEKGKNLKYKLVFSEEETPLGTGGALKKAEALIENNTFIVMNGDSFCKVDFNGLLNFHYGKRAILTIVLARSKTALDYGSIRIDETCRIKSFLEKSKLEENNIINAGIYVMQRDILQYMPDNDVFSLEYDIFPHIISKNVYGYLVNNQLIDIGTPGRYESARRKIMMELK